jgi:hypothetical protein
MGLGLAIARNGVGDLVSAAIEKIVDAATT